MKELREHLTKLKNMDINSDSAMTLGVDYFFSILKRLVSSGVKDVLLNNGIFISAYDLIDDGDESAFNHIIISEDSGYFYNQCKKINVKHMYEKLRDNNTEVEDYRKQKKIKPANKKSEIELYDTHFIITYYLDGNKYKSYKYELENPDRVFANDIMNMVNKVFNMFTANSVVLKEDYEYLLGEIELCPRTLMRETSINGKSIPYPFMKSFLFGVTKPDLLYSIINEVNVGKYSGDNNKNILGEIYAYTIVIEKNDILEFHLSYLVNYIDES